MISILKLVELGGLHSAGCLYDIFSQHLDFFRSFSNSFRFLLKVGGACNHNDISCQSYIGIVSGHVSFQLGLDLEINCDFPLFFLLDIFDVNIIVVGIFVVCW